MSATTKRLKITQQWQQVSTGNVTLMGCNTSAAYHIFVGADTPNMATDFITDKLSRPTAYNFDTPVWVKLNMTNQLDEADLLAIGALSGNNQPSVPVAPSPAHYKIVGNQVIVPIDGWLEIDDKVYNELAELNQRLTLFVGTMDIQNQGVLYTNTAMDIRSKGEYGIVSFNGVHGVSFNGAQSILLDNAMIANVLSSDGTKRTIMPVTEAIAISKYEGVADNADNADSDSMYIRKAGALTLAEFFDPRDAMSVVAWLKKICHLPDDIIYITFESNICFNPKYLSY